VSNACSFGYINLPVDKRQIPLFTDVIDPETRLNARIPSFALEIVSKYEQIVGITPKTIDNKTLKASIRTERFLYGGFISPRKFPTISAKKLIEGSESENSKCRHRIVIVGGTWHQFGVGRGPLIETFPSPVGLVPGLHLHANYVEALLDERFQLGVPLWVAILFDSIVGLFLYIAYTSSALSGFGHLAVLAAFLVPLAAAYIFFANAGRYLDFILPLSLCFVHLTFEYLKETWH
jgi:CHASE2 domain-containing sensor protein